MKRVIIVGASSGIGRELALRFAKEGCVVGIAARRIEELQKIREEYGEESIKIAQLDVCEPTATDALDSLISEVQRPELLIYASGIGKQNPSLDETIEINTVKTNCEGMVRIVDHFLNYVKNDSSYTPKSRAHIAVISSIAGTEGMGYAPAYSATKRMQSTYLTALSQHCRMYNIHARFTDIRPGFVATAILNPDKHYPMLMSLDKAADIIMRGIKHRRRIITFDWRFKLITLFWRIIPRPLWERLTFIKN